MATYNFNASSIQTKEGQKSLLSKSFFYMFLMVLSTVVVCVVTSLIFRACGLRTDVEVIPESVANAYFITMLTTGIMQIVLTVVIFFTCIKPGKIMIVPMALYTVCMGVLISSFSLFLDWWTMASVFGIAALAFGGMALIGTYSKRASVFGMVGFGLLFGVLLVSLFSVFMVIFNPGGALVLNIVVSAITVIAILLITVYDVASIKRIGAYYNENTGNMALLFAFNLYIDFILILVRLLQLVAIFGNRR